MHFLVCVCVELNPTRIIFLQHCRLHFLSLRFGKGFRVHAVLSRELVGLMVEDILRHLRN